LPQYRSHLRIVLDDQDLGFCMIHFLTTDFLKAGLQGNDIGRIGAP
jgi:hypothetical protein